MVKLKLTLPLAQLDAAREDMERFLHHRISEVGSQGELNDLLKTSQREWLLARAGCVKLCSSSAGPSDEILCDHRFTVYGKDSAEVHKVRAKILGLEDEAKPSQQNIDSSPIFALRRAADESGTPSIICLLYTSPSPRDATLSRMPSSA